MCSGVKVVLSVFVHLGAKKLFYQNWVNVQTDLNIKSSSQVPNSKYCLFLSLKSTIEYTNTITFAINCKSCIVGLRIVLVNIHIKKANYLHCLSRFTCTKLFELVLL